MPRESAIQRVLITGIAGSGGSYLAEYIVRNHPHVAVYGIARWHSTTAQSNLEGIRDRVTVHEADLMDFGSVLAVVDEVKPDTVFHLAAHANVRASFATPGLVLSNNIMGTANLLDVLRRLDQKPVIQLCSTSEVYGQVDPKDVPITENVPLRPVSPYAVSKLAQDMLGWSYFKSYGLPVVRTRMFTYLNPRRTDLFATAFAKQVAWIERGLSKELLHGNLESVRTFLDVRDAMRAYWLAAAHCTPGEVYNIGGTTTLTVGQVLERLIALSDCDIPTRTDPNLLRPADVTLQIPCVEPFERATGWQPEYGFQQSLADLLDFWRRQADKVVRQGQPDAHDGPANA